MTCPNCKGRGVLRDIFEQPACPKCKGVGQTPDSANEMTTRLLIEVPRRFQGTRVWRNNTGMAYGADAVRGAINCLHVGNIKGALDYLQRRPIQFGVVGQGDISGIAPGQATGVAAGRRVELEVKAGRDRMSEQQERFSEMIHNAGGVYVVVRDVDVALRELEEKL